MKIENSPKLIPQSFKALPRGTVRVSSNLIKGGRLKLLDFFELKKENVTQVIDINDNFPRFWQWLGCKLNGIKVIRVNSPFKAFGKMNREDYVRYSKMIEGNQGNTYLHCKCGMHRSSLVAAANEIIKGNKNYQEAMNWLRSSEGNYFNPKYDFANYEKNSKNWQKRLTQAPLYDRAMGRFVEIFGDRNR